jgi:hypothetical protein
MLKKESGVETPLFILSQLAGKSGSRYRWNDGLEIVVD